MNSVPKKEKYSFITIIMMQIFEMTLFRELIQEKMRDLRVYITQ